MNDFCDLSVRTSRSNKISKFDERHKMTTFINIQGYRHDILIRVIEKKRTFGLSKRRRTKKETRQIFGEGGNIW